MSKKLFGLVVALATTVAGCSSFPNAKTPTDAVLTAEDAFCIYEHASDPIAQLMLECNLPAQLLQDVVDAQGKAMARKAAAHPHK